MASKKNEKKSNLAPTIIPTTSVSILRDDLAKSRRNLEDSDAKIIVLDAKLNITHMNAAAEDDLGLQLEEVIGNPYIDTLSQIKQDQLSQRLQETLRSKKILTIREMRVDGDAIAHFVDQNYIPIVNKNGQVDGLMAFSKHASDNIDQDLINNQMQKQIQTLLTTVQQQESKINQLQTSLKTRYSFHNIVGQNRLIQNLYTLIEKIKETRTTVLISGETGVGKELFAKATHYESNRHKMPFISVNCASLPESLLESELFGHVKGSFTGAIRDKKGKFELAAGGTIFLDEIGELSLKTQVKLLRTLQEREIERIGDERTIQVDFRIIAATNRNLPDMVKEGLFRKDLYYRLNVVQLKVPPLRDRRDDIPLLIRFFIKKMNDRYDLQIHDLTQAVKHRLLTHDWPGNVRELEAVIEKACVLSDDTIISNVDIDTALSNAEPFVQTEKEGLMVYATLQQKIDTLEREYFLAAFAHCKGKINAVSQLTGLNRRTILNKVKKHGIQKNDFKENS